jgi:hypothetical protein
MLPVSNNGGAVEGGYYIVPHPPPPAIRRPPTYPHVQHGLVTQENLDLNLQSPHISAVLTKLHSDMPGLSMSHWPSMLGSKQSLVQPNRLIAFSKSSQAKVSKPRRPLGKHPTSDNLRKKTFDFAGKYYSENKRKAGQQKIAGQQSSKIESKELTDCLPDACECSRR